MSITPIEEDGNSPDQEPSGGDKSSGVRGLVGSLLSTLKQSGRTLVRRLRDPFGVAPKRSAATPHSQLRVSGQKRLTAASRTSEDSGQRPQPLPDATSVCSERKEEELRVYDPERGEAYITSDTWQDVER